MRLSQRQLNRATLERQRLARRERLAVEDAVRSIMALQAQEPASPYIALWARIAGFDPRELDEAFADGRVVKASLMRITLHAVAAEDYPVFHAAMRPSLRASRLYDRRFRDADLGIEQVDAAEPALLATSTAPRTAAQMTAALEPRFGSAAKRAWWAYRTYAQLHHAPTGGPWSFGPRPAFVAAPDALPPEAHGSAIDGLVRRYLASFGPASVADICAFTLLTRPVVRGALEHLGPELIGYEGPDGTELHDLRSAALPAADAPAPPRLLPMWESILLAYADRSRIIPDAYRPLVIRRNGDVLATLLIDGLVAGVWRLRDGAIEAAAFMPLSDEAWAGLAEEAASLLPLLEARDRELYRRHARWWDRLPPAQVRRLPASSG